MAEVTFIGTASGTPVPGRSHASCLLGAGAGSYLLDAGDGCCSSLRRSGIDPGRIRAVFISHMHPDHCAGLPMLLQMMYLDGRTGPLEVYVPGEGIDGVSAWLTTTYIFPEKLPFGFSLKPVAAGLFFQDEALAITACPNRHLEGYRELTTSQYPGKRLESYSFGIRIQGQRIVYSGDVASLGDLPPTIEGTDLLILEATHVAVDEIAQFAAQNRLPRVVLTHLHPDLEAREVWVNELRLRHGVRQLDLAFDGLRILV